MLMEQLYNRYQQSSGIQTDTRALKQGELFFALKGPHFNGNLFAARALDEGASAVVIDEPVLEPSDRVFLLPDALTALQQLAHHHRKQFSIPFIGITGSNGKTTTKELIHAVLSTQFITFTTKGNLNNHIGVPLTLLSIKKEAQMAIVEMGANHQQEIAAYCTIALPTHGIITNCGKAHLEGFGGVEGIRKGKGELYDHLASSNGTAFINSELEYLRPMAMNIQHKLFYGNQQGNVRTEVLHSSSLLSLEVVHPQWGKQIISTQLVGAYNRANVEVALCVGDYFGIPFEKMKAAIEAYCPDNARSQLIQKRSNTIVLDAYNANPSSMSAAIDNFSNMEGAHKWVCLGGMMELGEDSLTEHQLIVQQLQKGKFETVMLVGGDFLRTDHPFLSFANAEDAKTWLTDHLPEHTLLLIKGSRSMKMEKLLDAL
ncbi:MAG: UDP-N-acetylmuramoyl-tripeptide--D-alanyl-D-alanine ligase [Bacteroidetes bacterium]|nr:UDP-N-acetylmuramoyl-tripeptide--D-alanyl-D-alanine ligase [Bacteroidota bacterium]